MEAAVGVAGDDALLCRPAEGLGAPGVGADVGEGRVLRALRLPGETPEEGGQLGTGAGAVGLEGAVPGAIGDALLHGPAHGLRVVSAAGNIGEGDARKGRLDLDPAAGHGEGRLAAVQAGELDLPALAVGDGEGRQDIAAVGLDGEGHGVARRGSGGAGGDGAVVRLGHGDLIADAAGSAGGRTVLGRDGNGSGLFTAVVAGGGEAVVDLQLLPRLQGLQGSADLLHGHGVVAHLIGHIADDSFGHTVDGHAGELGRGEAALAHVDGLVFVGNVFDFGVGSDGGFQPGQVSGLGLQFILIGVLAAQVEGAAFCNGDSLILTDTRIVKVCGDIGRAEENCIPGSNAG